ncbi:MAG: deoxyribose-phosphate aldolase [Candidatus Methanofastidiosia archaeon]|jgi:deoxyribose-phosphate aldolase
MTKKIPRTELAAMIDHTLLKPGATRNQILTVCAEAKQYTFASVCVNSCWVDVCSTFLKESAIAVCTVVGFPLGAAETQAKVCEAETAVKNGASEIDMVLNIGKFLSDTQEDTEYVQNDIQEVVEAVSPHMVKVILETGLLTNDQIVKACIYVKKAGAHFVKTSTGFGPPFTLEHVELMRSTVGKTMGVKAAGGIKSYQDAVKVIEAGANRIGASAGVTIVEGAP